MPIEGLTKWIVGFALCLWILWGCDDRRPFSGHGESGLEPLPAFQGGTPATMIGGDVTGPSPVPFIEPKKIWDRFLIFVWQYDTDVVEDLELYERVGFMAFHIDRGAEEHSLVEFAQHRAFPYYVDHAAGRGYLHLTEETGRNEILGKSHIVVRPYSLADPEVIGMLKDNLAENVATTRLGPVTAYAFDDEISTGSFNSPAEVDGSPLSREGYRDWLRKSYQRISKLNETWGANLEDFSQAVPVSFEVVRRAHTDPPFGRWNLSMWMDWRSYMDTQFARCLADLTRFTNALDPSTPAGFVGGQQPAPYGGYDYEKICRSVQWIEAYDIGGTTELLRSLWSWPERRPYVQTWFSSGDAKSDAWFLWYYLLHGNRGVIAWPELDGSWFGTGPEGVAPFIAENRAVIREVQGEISEFILDVGTRFEADPIAVYYSHPSVQASWVMDVVTHGRTWPERSSSLDDQCQSAGKNRVAWFKLLEDCGFQYNVVTPGQVKAGELVEQGYRVLILNRTIAMSDLEAEAIRQFVRRGGTVIADHLTGLLDEHGVGRREGGALDGLFGLRRDESRGYLDGKHITEIDGQYYEEPFLDRLKYRGARRYEGMVVYERGTRSTDATPKDSVIWADVVMEKRVGAGRTVYLNLTPLAYIDHSERLGPLGDNWRALLRELLAESEVYPRATVLSDGTWVPLAELVYWRNEDRLIVGLVKNPTRQATTSEAGQVQGVAGEDTINVEIVFREPFSGARDLRTGAKLPAGKTIRAYWKPWEALLFEVE